MAIAIIVPDYDAGPLCAALAALAPGVPVRVWPRDSIADATLAVLWAPPPGALEAATQLQAMISFGAGVDFFFRDSSLPQVPIARLGGDAMARMITRYVLAVVLPQVRDFDRYRQLQREQRWQPAPAGADPTIGVLGLGEIGGRVARAFCALGFTVHGWRRTAGSLNGIEVHSAGPGLDRILSLSDYIINVLPLTPATRNLLNEERFAACKRDAWLINVGRGQTVVEADLLAALDQRLSGATLDVFHSEPLPRDHPLWRHPKVQITPHIAALTDVDDAAEQIVDTYHRIQRGLAPRYLVDRDAGY